jgi:predicted transcriptional regulator
MTKAKQIREFKQANPTHKPSDIAKACGVKTTYVYQVLHADKHKKVKAAKPITKLTLATAGQELLRKEIQRLHNEVDKWRNLSDLQERRVITFMEQVRELKLHHNGLEYVISYLESRLGITEKPNGASV